MPNSNNYGVFCYSGWCELDHMNGCGSKEKAEHALAFYSSHPDNTKDEFILAQHTDDCTKKISSMLFSIT